jgi:Arc/MetJ-type ribon-helix-helix transcriptional regulator
MQQTKISIKDEQVEFLENHKLYGYKDKSSMVREALKCLKEEVERKSLRQSADLYAEIYKNDSELKELTESAISGWPE